MGLVILILVGLSLATLFTNTVKGKLANSIVNFFLMSLMAIRDYGVSPGWFIFCLVLAIVNAVFVVIFANMYLDERKSSKRVIETNNTEKFLKEIEKRYGS